MRTVASGTRAFGVLAAMPLAVATMSALPARAAEETGPESPRCKAEREIFELAAEYAPLSPADGATAQAGSAVTFTVETDVSNPQVRFDIASSAASLTNPDIDSGAGVQQGGGSGGTTTYTFTSTKAAAKARTVYWQVAFTHVLESCGNSPVTVRTPVRTLKVVGEAPGGGGSSGEEHKAGSPSTSWSSPTASPAHLRVGITAVRVLDLRRPVLAYLIDCTARCVGHTSVRAWLVRRHKHARRMRGLEFGPRSVSIKDSIGGHERFRDRYTGRALRQLRRLMHGGASVKLQVVVAVDDASGKLTQTHAVISVRR
jgi:hypothetical protein